jgi:hypothetical protein
MKGSEKMTDPKKTKAQPPSEIDADDTSLEVVKEKKKTIIETGSINADLKELEKKDKGEMLPKIHSVIGHMAQGDTYKNSLALIFDRLSGDAEAPEYVVPTEDGQREDEALEVDSSAFEPFHFSDSLGSVNTEKSNPGVEITPPPPATKDTPKESNTESLILGSFREEDFERLKQLEIDRAIEREGQIEGFSMDDFDRLANPDEDSDGGEESSTEEALSADPTLADPPTESMFSAPQGEIEEPLTDPFAKSIGKTKDDFDTWNQEDK